ncbi:hypothetical protein N7493_002100 [Penicillium malachiteum]|uniref:Uncharacterized protein n=1 Tax=Penicillium malachiteum TaxID=1324776 RepID=A0AAD6N0G7_9EURO|nr:hypothetical protein N7493_002100 [Penicillium malachiteum]
MAVPDKEPWAEGAEKNRGQRLLPHVVDYYAYHDPDRIFAAVYNSDGVENGFQDVTAKTVANAVDQMAWWLSKNLKSNSRRRTLAYIGPSDLRYTVIFLAAIKCRWKTFFISSKNPLTLNLGLLQQADVSALLFADTLRTLAKSFQKFDPSISCKQVPSLSETLNARAPPYRFDASWQHIKDDNCLILHSAGSTGPPKLINYTHAAISCTDNDAKVPVPEGRRAQNATLFMFDTPSRFYPCFPAFHLAGVQAYILIPCFYPTCTVVMGPPYGAPSGGLVESVMSQQDIRALWMTPQVIEHWVSTIPSAIKRAETLDFIILGGGTVPKAVGDKLNKVTDLCSLYGTIEISQVQMLVPRRGDWQYLEPNPAEECDMQEVDEGIFELVLHNDKKFIGQRTLSHTFPNVKTWRCQDLFLPHPTRPGLWKFHARIDDIVVLANNEKLLPVVMERIITENPLVSGALVVGNGRPEVILLVEPRSSPEVDRMSKKEFIDAIWPSVAQANETAPIYGKIRRSRITLSQPNLGFFRSPKGAISRKPTESLYAEYINAAFVDGTTDEQNEVGVLENYWIDETKRFIGSIVHDIRPEARLSETDDLFMNNAMDSLSVLELGQKLKLGLAGRMDKEKNNIDFWMRTIFDNPTIEDLAAATLDAVCGSGGGGSSQSQIPYGVDNFVEGMIAQLPEPRSTSPPPPLDTEELRIVLLGSQGRLGPYLVKTLLEDDRVAGVKCLDRGQNGQELFQARADELSLGIDAEDPRLQFVSINLSRSNLGLPEKHLNEIYQYADVIIHNLWSVHYALSLASFAPQILRSVASVIDIANRAESRPRVVFTSSVASVHRWGVAISPVVPVPEEVINCSEAAMASGYGQSKQVAERFLAAAGAKLNIPISILRVSQICGPVNIPKGGKWKSYDFLHSLSIISKASGLIPSSTGTINWMPVDQAASTIRDIALTEVHDSHETGTPNVQLYNIAHPQPVPIKKFEDALQKFISSPKLVSYSDWVTHLSNLLPNTISKEAEEVKSRVLPFFKTVVYEGENLYVIDKAKAVSPTMASMGPIASEAMEKWCESWTESEE